MVTKNELDEYANTIFLQNKVVGWWDDPNRCVYETIQLVSTEVAEATEGERKDLMDDHLPHRRMGEVELADAFIRLLDLGGRYNWKVAFDNLDNAVDVDFNREFESESIGSKHLLCNMAIIKLAHVISKATEFDFNKKTQYSVDQYNIERAYSAALATLYKTADVTGYDIVGAMDEKLEYNKHRSDHKRENRAKQNGKKF